MMNRFSILILLATFACRAEVIKLRDGKSVAGTVVSLTEKEIILSRCGMTEKYSRDAIASIDLASNTATEPCGIPRNTTLQLPAGTAIEVRMLDFVDSSREPPGQTFRGVVESAVSIEGRLVISAGARLVLKLVQVPDAAGSPVLSLDLRGVQLGKDWASFDNIGPASTAAVSDVEVLRTSMTELDSSGVVLKNLQILVPAKTRLRFSLKQKIQLSPEKS